MDPIQTKPLSHPPSIIGWGSCGGKLEAQGPLGHLFDYTATDSHFGQDTWEQAESFLQQQALLKALSRAQLGSDQLDLLLGGDLNDQCTATSYSARELKIPLAGLYGACSTMALGLGLAALLIDSGSFHQIGALTSSHFCTAERQYRTPLGYGCQRTPTAQWTATASGAVILSSQGAGPWVTHVTFGRVVDLGIHDANNMGAAMAPAAADTIRRHLLDTGRSADFYDLIITGDLGSLGKELVSQLLRQQGYPLTHYSDCGELLYDAQKQDVHCGGSGCGCSAAVLAAHLIPGLRTGHWKHLLFCGTGALHSPTALGQGESIPGICHAVALTSQPPSGGM